MPDCILLCASVRNEVACACRTRMLLLLGWVWRVWKLHGERPCISTQTRREQFGGILTNLCRPCFLWTRRWCTASAVEAAIPYLNGIPQCTFLPLVHYWSCVWAWLGHVLQYQRFAGFDSYGIVARIRIIITYWKFEIVRTGGWLGIERAHQSFQRYFLQQPSSPCGGHM